MAFWDFVKSSSDMAFLFLYGLLCHHLLLFMVLFIIQTKKRIYLPVLWETIHQVLQPADSRTDSHRWATVPMWSLWQSVQKAGSLARSQVHFTHGSRLLYSQLDLHFFCRDTCAFVISEIIPNPLLYASRVFPKLIWKNLQNLENIFAKKYMLRWCKK